MTSLEKDAASFLSLVRSQGLYLKPGFPAAPVITPAPAGAGAAGRDNGAGGQVLGAPLVLPHPARASTDLPPLLLPLLCSAPLPVSLESVSGRSVVQQAACQAPRLTTLLHSLSSKGHTHRPAL